MRVYIPATLAILHDPAGVAPASAHAVTPALAAALPEEDEEALEYVALLAAADESVALLAADASAPRRRVVLAVDVDGPVRGRDGGLPSSVTAPAHVPWSQVVSLHVDDVDAVADVEAAVAAGDDPAADDDGVDALDRAAEHDLLWYDVSELELLRAAAPPTPA